MVFPYNFYYPQPYERFTVQGLVTERRDLLVGEEYWDFIGGKDTLKELFSIFDLVGKEYKEKIALKISQVANSKQTF